MTISKNEIMAKKILNKKISNISINEAENEMKTLYRLHLIFTDGTELKLNAIQHPIENQPALVFELKY